MQSVGDEGGRSDAAADSYVVGGNDLVASEADQTGNDHNESMSQGLWVEESSDRLPPSDQRGQANHDDDEDSGGILGAPEPIGVTARRWSATEDERHPERDRGKSVSEVVNRVRQQRD
jgi:hypothetical protein